MIDTQALYDKDAYEMDRRIDGATDELHKIARETYIKTRIGRPHMPTPDSVEGQRKIDRLFDILAKSLE